MLDRLVRPIGHSWEEHLNESSMGSPTGTGVSVADVAFLPSAHVSSRAAAVFLRPIGITGVW